MAFPMGKHHYDALILKHSTTKKGMLFKLDGSRVLETNGFCPTHLTMTGFSLPATNPNPSSGCLVKVISLGLGFSSIKSVLGSS